MVLETSLAILTARVTTSRDVVVGRATPEGPVLLLRLEIDLLMSVSAVLARVSSGRRQAVDCPSAETLFVLRELPDVDESRDVEVFIEYGANLIDEAHIGQWTRMWEQLLREIADGPERSLRGLALMSCEDERELLAQGDRLSKAPLFVPVTRLIARAAAIYEAGTAVEYGDQRVTYRELSRQANHLAEGLSRYGVKRGDVVAVFIDRGIELVVAQLAVMAAAAVPLPIDPELPARRVDAMLAGSRARLVLSSDSGAIGVSNILPVLDVVTMLGDIPDSCTATLAVEEVTSDDASYVLFTSGSTGRPKGVVNTHGALANRLAWMQDTYQLTQSDSILYKTPISFDVSMWEWLWPLTAGACVVVAENGTQRDPVAIARDIRRHGVTLVHFVPSMLRHFTAQPEAADCPTLRQIICSGEELTPAAVDEALSIFPAVDNLYGPTEAAIDVTWWSCSHGDDKTPIGRPIPGVSLRVVDGAGGLVPVGVPGELLIGGIALARGYSSRPGRTASTFVADSWADGKRLYRTGDRVRWREPGVLEFLGRLDAQVKIRGVRVEPMEVEIVLGTFPGVLEGVVVVQIDDRKGPKLVAYVTGSVVLDDLRAYLRTRLPEVMVPHPIIGLDEMPRTASGKIDRARLSEVMTAP
ncbi:hypothetical protein BJF87_13660 [Gordonia sp. CNJ-863]|nr:hypothetical protein BJF87_13660 [Gordonia sp. CNJ-863]